MNEKFAFLSSTRFWAIVIGAVALALNQEGILSDAWVTAITTITGGFVVVGTADRATEVIANGKPTPAKLLKKG